MTSHLRYMFREYDIRGRVGPGELDEVSIGMIAQAFALFLSRRGVKDVVVGYDNRNESPVFAQKFIKVLSMSGCHVYDIGLCITPAAYFAQYKLKAQGMAMITASHNPNGWCGCKLGYDYSTTMGPEDIMELYEILESHGQVMGGQGHIEKADIREAYLQDIIDKVPMPENHNLKVVVDAGNGAAGLFAWELFQRLGCLTFQLNCDPDDTYPHYFPNPSDLTARKRLAEMVTHPYIGAAIGFSFDGDGDRLGITDETGKNIWSDRILMILARQFLENHAGAKIVYDVKCTKALEEDIIAHGGVPVMWRTGHSYIKRKMREVGAALAGERSGHIFIGEDFAYGYDDAMLAAALLCRSLAQANKPLSKLMEDYPSYYTSPEIKAPCPDHLKYQVVKSITRQLVEEFGEENVNTINGARVTFPEGWGLVRASSNLPELVLVFEAQDEAGCRKIRDLFYRRLQAYPDVDTHWYNDMVDDTTCKES